MKLIQFSYFDPISGYIFSYTVQYVLFRHGFNKQTPKFFAFDQLKRLLLTLALMLPIMAGIIWIVKAGGSLFYFYVWAFIFAVQVFVYWS